MQIEFDYIPSVIGAVIYILYRCFAAHVNLSISSRRASRPVESTDKAPKNVPLILHSCSEGISSQFNAQHEEPSAEEEPEAEDNCQESPLDDPNSKRRSRFYVSLFPMLPWMLISLMVGVLGGLCVVRSYSAHEGLARATKNPYQGIPQSTPPIVQSMEVPVSPAQAEQTVGSMGSVIPPENIFTSKEKPVEKHIDNFVTLNLTRQQMQYTMNGISYYKSAFWGRLSAGTPAQNFKIVFDTGSGHLILPSTYCASSTCRAHKRYRRSTSKTAVDIDYDGSVVAPGDPRDQITVSFGTGEVTGVFVEDVVCVNDDAFENKKLIKNQRPATDPKEIPDGCMKMRMIAATDMSEEPFKSFHFDGVLGLGLSSLSQAPEFNFMNVISQSAGKWGASQASTFAVFLADSSEESSAITLGGYAEERVAGSLSWAPVYQPTLGHWMVKVHSLKVDGVPVNYCAEGCQAVVDTGTSLLAVPTPSFPEIFELLRHAVPPSGMCSGPGPTLQFELDHNFTISLGPQDYSRLERTPSGTSLENPADAGEDGELPAANLKDMYCKPMLMAMDLPAPLGPKLFILGEPVLRKYYTVYDTHAKRIGFGRAQHIGSTVDDNDDWWDE